MTAVEALARRESKADAPDLPRRPHPGVVAAAALVAAAATLPAIYLLVRALAGGAAAFADALAGPRILGLLARTTALGAAVTATALAIAVPLAWLTLRTDLPGRRAWVVVSALPLVIPSFVGGYAFVAAFGPRGILQGWLEPLGVDRLPTIYGFGGAWLVLSLFTYPLALLPVRAAMARADPSLEEAARALGRTRAEAIFRVTLPQLRPAVVVGGLLVALYTMSDFGVVSLLRFDSFTRAIYIAHRTTFGTDGTRTAVLGLILVALVSVVLVAEIRTRGRGVYHGTHRGVRRHAPVVHLGVWRWPAVAVCVVIVGLALVVPVAVIAIWLVRGVNAGVPIDVAVGPAVRSIEASLLGALFVLVAASPIAVLSARYRGWLARMTEAASYIGYAMPGIVIGIALVFLGARVPAIYQTLPFLVFAYVVHFLPQATGTLRTSIAQLHPGVEEAARSLGASPGEVLRRVTLPLVRPGALTAFSLVFLTVMKELPMTLLLRPTEYSTLATEVWDAASAARFSAAALPALALVLLSSVPMSLLVAREQREVTRQPKGA